MISNGKKIVSKEISHDNGTVRFEIKQRYNYGDSRLFSRKLTQGSANSNSFYENRSGKTVNYEKDWEAITYTASIEHLENIIYDSDFGRMNRSNCSTQMTKYPQTSSVMKKEKDRINSNMNFQSDLINGFFGSSSLNEEKSCKNEFVDHTSCHKQTIDEHVHIFTKASGKCTKGKQKSLVKSSDKTSMLKASKNISGDDNRIAENFVTSNENPRETLENDQLRLLKRQLQEYLVNIKTEVFKGCKKDEHDSINKMFSFMENNELIRQRLDQTVKDILINLLRTQKYEIECFHNEKESKLTEESSLNPNKSDTNRNIYFELKDSILRDDFRQYMDDRFISHCTNKQISKIEKLHHLSDLNPLRVKNTFENIVEKIENFVNVGKVEKKSKEMVSNFKESFGQIDLGSSVQERTNNSILNNQSTNDDYTIEKIEIPLDSFCVENGIVEIKKQPENHASVYVKLPSYCKEVARIQMNRLK
ncbi:uncharacterized protein LOC111637913 [Centruroides sculpturatus]|uniref:uncharacterized protein LOC111637913 n=1 Tax=Centruroides sculpturatus TaxID=218467 RepID=UPI000C6D89CB|nr:uncharacterized protein LOC111637913 [Centruroides sculpturatus]